MPKRFTCWIGATITFQLLTAAIHSLSFIVKPVAANDTEEQMLKLMGTYRMDMGNGFFRTFSEIVISLSSSLTLLCLFAGLLNWFLKRKNLRPEIWKGVLAIETFIFGIFFLIMLRFAFLPPIVCIGLIFLGCLASRLSIKPIAST